MLPMPGTIPVTYDFERTPSIFIVSLQRGGKSFMADRLNGQHIHFVKLQTSVFCVECEVISENNTPFCFACGSQAVLSLSRLLGGSLRGQQTAQLIHDRELDRLVGELLSTVPNSLVESSIPSYFAPPARCRERLTRAADADLDNSKLSIHPAEVDLEPTISIIAERAQTLTRASGAALALRHGNEIICRARTGRTAPDLGVRLQSDSGISADCVRTGEIMLCNDAENHPLVDVESCRRLGARSILVAPLRHVRKTWGVFEVLSRTPNAFHDNDVATMKRMADVMVAAISRLSNLQASGAHGAAEPYRNTA